MMTMPHPATINAKPPTFIPSTGWRAQPCYYVSCIDGDRFSLLAGPFSEHESALALVQRATTLAWDLDPKGPWYAYGTVKMIDGRYIGKLNDHLDVLIPDDRDPQCDTALDRDARNADVLHNRTEEMG
jgi:hypothetical protein